MFLAGASLWGKQEFAEVGKPGPADKGARGLSQVEYLTFIGNYFELRGKFDPLSILFSLVRH